MSYDGSSSPTSPSSSWLSRGSSSGDHSSKKDDKSSSSSGSGSAIKATSPRQVVTAVKDSLKSPRLRRSGKDKDKDKDKDSRADEPDIKGRMPPAVLKQVQELVVQLAYERQMYKMADVHALKQRHELMSGADQLIKFSYACALSRLPKPKHKQKRKKGIRLLRELVASAEKHEMSEFQPRDLWFYLAKAYFWNEQFSESRDWLDKMLAIEPDNLQARTFRTLLTQCVRLARNMERNAVSSEDEALAASLQLALTSVGLRSANSSSSTSSLSESLSSTTTLSSSSSSSGVSSDAGAQSSGDGSSSSSSSSSSASATGSPSRNMQRKLSLRDLTGSNSDLIKSTGSSSARRRIKSGASSSSVSRRRRILSGGSSHRDDVSPVHSGRVSGNPLSSSSSRSSGHAAAGDATFAHLMNAETKDALDSLRRNYISQTRFQKILEELDPGFDLLANHHRRFRGSFDIEELHSRTPTSKREGKRALKIFVFSDVIVFGKRQGKRSGSLPFTAVRRFPVYRTKVELRSGVKRSLSGSGGMGADADADDSAGGDDALNRRRSSGPIVFGTGGRSSDIVERDGSLFSSPSTPLVANVIANGGGNQQPSVGGEQSGASSIEGKAAGFLQFIDSDADGDGAADGGGGGDSDGDLSSPSTSSMRVSPTPMSNGADESGGGEVLAVSYEGDEVVVRTKQRGLADAIDAALEGERRSWQSTLAREAGKQHIVRVSLLESEALAQLGLSRTHKTLAIMCETSAEQMRKMMIEKMCTALQLPQTQIISRECVDYHLHWSTEGDGAERVFALDDTPLRMTRIDPGLTLVFKPYPPRSKSGTASVMLVDNRAAGQERGEATELAEQEERGLVRVYLSDTPLYRQLKYDSDTFKTLYLSTQTTTASVQETLINKLSDNINDDNVRSAVRDRLSRYRLWGLMGESGRVVYMDDKSHPWVLYKRASSTDPAFRFVFRPAVPLGAAPPGSAAAAAAASASASGSHKAARRGWKGSRHKNRSKKVAKASSAARRGVAEVSMPTGVRQRLRVDEELTWSGQDPTKSFTIHRKLGTGAYGCVFAATHNDSGIKLAIKEVFCPDADSMASIESEMNILKQCRHPDIVGYFGCCRKADDSRDLWILMDLCEIGSVLDLMRTLPSRCLSERQICAIIVPILRGLVYLHSLDVVHRDIKVCMHRERRKEEARKH
jgi:tetratricopeptide (TPR) repeat protein